MPPGPANLTANALATTGPSFGATAVNKTILTANPLATTNAALGAPSLTQITTIANLTATPLTTSAPAMQLPRLLLASTSGRVLLGAFPEGGGKFGLRVGKTGYNAGSNPVNDENLIFSSDWPAVLPIHAIGTVSLTAGATQTVSFTSFGYTPHFSAFVKNGSLDWQAFQMSNTLRIPVWSSTLSTNSHLEGPLNEMVYDGSGTENILVQIRLFADHVTIYSNVAIQVTYIIYHI